MLKSQAHPTGLAILFVAGLFGCGQTQSVTPPKTYMVEGVVVRKDGTPFPGGMINFRPAAPSEFSSNGLIQDDGTFTLETIAGNAKVAGAQEGEHHVMVLPKGTTQDLKPIVLKKTYKVEPADNKITVRLEQ